jgi:CRISPR/Cas system-associated exonuclease Cas4 (RecB family)
MRLSQVGHCGRALAYADLGVPKRPPDEAALRRMALGHVFEDKAVQLLEFDGHVITDRQREVSLLGVDGHIDGILTTQEGNRFLLEVKSGGSRAFRDFKSNGIRFAESPWLRKYYAQAQAYLAALNEAGERLSEVRIFYCQRDERKKDPTSGFKTAEETLPVDTMEVAVVKSRIERVQKCVAVGEAPDILREHDADDGKLCLTCRFCDYKQLCWGMTKMVGKEEVLCGS